MLYIFCLIVSASAASIYNKEPRIIEQIPEIPIVVYPFHNTSISVFTNVEPTKWNWYINDRNVSNDPFLKRNLKSSIEYNEIYHLQLKIPNLWSSISEVPGSLVVSCNGSYMGEILSCQPITIYVSGYLIAQLPHENLSMIWNETIVVSMITELAKPRSNYWNINGYDSKIPEFKRFVKTEERKYNYGGMEVYNISLTIHPKIWKYHQQLRIMNTRIYEQHTEVSITNVQLRNLTHERLIREIESPPVDIINPPVYNHHHYKNYNEISNTAIVMIICMMIFILIMLTVMYLYDM